MSCSSLDPTEQRRRRSVLVATRVISRSSGRMRLLGAGMGYDDVACTAVRDHGPHGR